MSYFFKVLRYTFYAILAIVILIVLGLNIYYSILYKSINEREFPDPSSLTSNHVHDELVNYNINLIPYPHKVELIPGLFEMPDEWSFRAPIEIQEQLNEVFEQVFDRSPVYKSNGLIRFVPTPEIISEGYHLTLKSDFVEILYSDITGAYYGLLTLKQLNKIYSGIIPNMKIEDYPDLSIRGVMLDISRDKVPTLETLYGIIDILADLKYNHLELYVEGFSFAYPSFESLWKGKETPIIGEEIRALDQYCKRRFIDLVPNQNSLGHMAAWLETDQFVDLAECPDGYNLTPFMKMKTTIDPYDPRSIRLVEDMIQDIIPYFGSSYFNANLDEPFELGHCKSKKMADEVGVGRVYLDFAKKVHNIINTHDKRMMMWGDVVLKHPEIVSEIPKDIILLDWGYEAEYPFKKNGLKFKESGLDFIVCAGTSSWTSIGGRTNNMVGNILNAVKSGLEHDAIGMLLTDWGDMGHWQYLPVSYAGFVVGGGLSWNAGSYNESMILNYLDAFIYEDANERMGSYTFELGRYNQFEEILAPNMTLVNLGFQFGFIDQVLYQTILNSFPSTFESLAPEGLASIIQERFKLRHPYQYEELLNYIDDLEQSLDKADMKNPDSDLIKDEFENAMLLIRVGAGLKNYIEHEQDMSRNEKIQYLENMKRDYSIFLEEHKRLWMNRNKGGGIDRSMRALLNVETEINDQIELLNSNMILRAWDRLKDRTIAAAAGLIL
jgi:hypothetical protein